MKYDFDDLELLQQQLTKTYASIKKFVKESSKLDVTELEEESADVADNIQTLILEYSALSRVRIKINNKLAIVVKNKLIYYNTENNYPPKNQKETNILMEADEEIQTLDSLVMLVDITLKMIEDSKKNLETKGWKISDIIKYRMFLEGN